MVYDFYIFREYQIPHICLDQVSKECFEDTAIFNGYPVICKWEGMMPPKCKKCT